MAKNITLMGANYPDVPAVDLPKTGGGTARFVDMDGVLKSATTTVNTDSLGNSGNIMSQGDGVIVAVYDNKRDGAGAGYTCIPFKVRGYYKVTILDGVTPYANQTGFPIKYYYI